MIPDINSNIIAFTDGSCSRNGTQSSKGGIGVYFLQHIDNIQQVLNDSQYKATNQRAELQAVISAIEAWIDSDYKQNPLFIYSDSQYTVKICTEWMYSWMNKNIIKMNWDLVTRLYQLIEPRQSLIQFVHVRGHQKVNKDDSLYTQFIKIGNQNADYLASSVTTSSDRQLIDILAILNNQQ